MAHLQIRQNEVYYSCDQEIKPVSAIFVHGAGSSHATWDYQMNEFQDILPCIFLDLPGHGQSSGETFAAITDYSDWLQEFWLTVGVEHPLLIGHSMGSAIIMEAALSGASVKGLITVGGGARLRVAPALLDLIHSNFQRAADMIAHNLFHSKTLDDYFRKVQQDLITCGQQGVLNDFLACDHFDVMQQLSAIKVPVTAIVGSKDGMTPPKYSAYLSETIPSCVFEIIDDAGHMVMAEQAEIFNLKLRSFLLHLTRN